MSAYLVNNETINCIVNGAIQLRDRFDREIDPQQAGEMLIKENCRSLNSRYDDDPEKISYPFVFKRQNYDKKDIYGCTACYNYQACESEDYELTEAAEFIRYVQQRLLLSFIGEEYPWGLDTPNTDEEELNV